MPESFRALPPGVRTYIWSLVALYLVAAALGLPRSHPEVIAGLTVIFAAAGLVKPVTNPLGGISDPNSGLVIVAALLWQAPDVLLGVSLGSFLGLVFFRRNELWRACTNGVGWGIPAAAAALVAHAITSETAPAIAPLVIAAGLAVITNRTINTAIFAVYRSQRFKHPFLADWFQSLSFQWVSQLLSAPLAIVLAAIAGRIQTEWSGLVLTAAYAMALPVARQEYAYYNRSRETLDETVEAVVRALEGADPGAREHGDRVSVLAVETGRRLGMSDRALIALRLASRLHDVGLLAGPGDGGAEEHHASAGARILAQFPDPMIGEFVRAHHERWDGQGYPDHLHGKAIPLGARVLAAAEIYDSVRFGLSPAEGARSTENAGRHLEHLAGHSLDPRVVTVLLGVTKEWEQNGQAVT